MKILHLTLKKHWFDMIASGEKKEEYREIKPYWDKRLQGREYGAVMFKNGYGNVPSVLVELVSIDKGYGLHEWGAPAFEKVYILRLGEIINKYGGV